MSHWCFQIPQYRRIILALLSLVFLAAGYQARAEEPTETLKRVIGAYSKRLPLEDPLPAFAPQTMIEIQDYLILDAGRDYGLVSGYLYDHSREPPVVGLLLENMFSSTGATLKASPAVDQIVSTAWAVRMRRDLIDAEAGSVPMSELIGELIPAVVFQDELLPETQRRHSQSATAVNLGLRYVVLGQALGNVKWDAAPGFRTELEGPDQSVLSTGEGLSPKPADLKERLLATAEVLRQRGRMLRTDDLVLLGLGDGVVLNEASRATARFQAGTEERRIVFAIRR
ncbi:MAG: hypothetical protein VW311_05365 [Gammaproteobacteria bacterium]